MLAFICRICRTLSGIFVCATGRCILRCLLKFPTLKILPQMSHCSRDIFCSPGGRWILRCSFMLLYLTILSHILHFIRRTFFLALGRCLLRCAAMLLAPIVLPHMSHSFSGRFSLSWTNLLCLCRLGAVANLVEQMGQTKSGLSDCAVEWNYNTLPKKHCITRMYEIQIKMETLKFFWIYFKFGFIFNENNPPK